MKKRRPVPAAAARPSSSSSSSIAATIARVSGLAQQSLEPSDEDIARLLALEVGISVMHNAILIGWLIDRFLARSTRSLSSRPPGGSSSGPSRRCVRACAAPPTPHPFPLHHLIDQHSTQ